MTNNINDQKNSVSQDMDLMEMFGLTEKQTVMMIALQRMMVKNDIIITKHDHHRVEKKRWLEKWRKAIYSKLTKDDNIYKGLLYSDDIIPEIKKEVKTSNNHTWLYIMILECIAFEPYFPLKEERRKLTETKDNVEDFKKLHYHRKDNLEYLRNSLGTAKLIEGETFDRLCKTFNHNINKICGKRKNIIIGAVSIVAMSAIAAALTAVAAPQIAVIFFGAQFPALSGAALANACLAMAGGGAIAAGGAGMAGGVAAIAGGGALLGLAAGGTAAGLVGAFMEASPEYTLSQAAKLETILKEIVLNAQKDVVSAQKVIKQLQSEISEMNKKLSDLELEDKKNKKIINNLKKSIEYMKKAHKDLKVYTSSFEEGLKAQDKQKTS